MVSTNKYDKGTPQLMPSVRIYNLNSFENKTLNEVCPNLCVVFERDNKKLEMNNVAFNQGCQSVQL